MKKNEKKKPGEKKQNVLFASLQRNFAI